MSISILTAKFKIKSTSSICCRSIRDDTVFGISSYAGNKSCVQRAQQKLAIPTSLLNFGQSIQCIWFKITMGTLCSLSDLKVLIS